MRRIILIVAMLLVALVAVPVSASSLGISPSGPLELNILSSGTGTLDFTVSGVVGNLHIDLEDIPLSLSPGDVSVVEGQVVTVIIQGNGTNGVYNGKIRFLASSGNVAVGIKVKLTVNVGVVVEIPLPASIPVGGTSGWSSAPSTVSSSDSKVSLSVPSGTVMRTAAGQLISELTVTPISNPPPAPQNFSVVGMVYDFGPSGAVFDSPITLTFKYSDSDIPKGVDEVGLTVAYYNEAVSKWIELTGCVVDPVANTVTVSVSHFTRYAILAKLLVVSPPLVTPTIPESIVSPVPTPAVVIPVPPVVVPTPQAGIPTPEQPVVPIGVSGWLIFGLEALVLVVGFGGYVVWKRKRVKK